MRCPACSHSVSDVAAFCDACGARLLSAAMETATSAGDVVARPSLRDHAKIAGTILVGRYRIVGLLGRGGMGEVYRADDLKLAQPVAHKFLPRSVATEPAALARFHNEVRVARQVSHPNVCRIYDLSEADGQHFLSMEYIDGEDAAAVAGDGSSLLGWGWRASHPVRRWC
jgi:Protein kinase domain